MSLGSGVLFGTLLAYGAYKTSVNPKDFVFIFGECAYIIYIYIYVRYTPCINMLFAFQLFRLFSAE